MKDLIKIIVVLSLLWKLTTGILGVLWVVMRTLLRVLWFPFKSIKKCLWGPSRDSGYHSRMAKKKYHYVYLTEVVSNSGGESKYYIGKHSSNIHPNKDDYVGSGNYIKKAKELNEHYISAPPYSFKRKVLKYCKTSAEAFAHEAELIRSVRGDKRYLNSTLKKT